MKYYAVTDDPNELMHYGIKGMKWGVIRTDAQLGHPKAPARTRTRSAKPRSPAYQKASAKLSSAMQRGIAKAQANWKEYNSPANKALRQEKRDYSKAVRDYKRGERKFEKHVQLARQGRLKYKGISDSEVQRITDRLMLENRARAQSGNEKQSLRRRVGEAVSNGIVTGVGQGTSGYISARMTGRGQTTAKIQGEKRMAAYHNSLQGRLAANRENRANMRNVKAEQKRANTKAEILEKYNVGKEQRDLRRKNERELNALIIAHDTMNYSSVYDGDNKPKLTFRAKDTKKLTDAEVQARIAMLQDTKKLYGSSEDARIKNKNNIETESWTDEDGNVHTTTRAMGNGGKKGNKANKNSNSSAETSDDSAPVATPHAAPARNTHNAAQVMSTARNAHSNRNRDASTINDAIARQNALFDQLAAEQQASNDYWKRIHDFNAAAERANSRKTVDEGWALRNQRLSEQDREQRYWANLTSGGPIRDPGSRVQSPSVVVSRVGSGNAYSPTSSVSQQSYPNRKKQHFRVGRPRSNTYYAAKRG